MERRVTCLFFITMHPGRWGDSQWAVRWRSYGTFTSCRQCRHVCSSLTPVRHRQIFGFETTTWTGNVLPRVCKRENRTHTWRSPHTRDEETCTVRYTHGRRQHASKMASHSDLLRRWSGSDRRHWTERWWSRVLHHYLWSTRAACRLRNIF